MIDRLIDRWLDRVPRTALYAYGIRRWAAGWAQALLGPIVVDDPE